MEVAAATLADEFLADLDSDEEIETEEENSKINNNNEVNNETKEAEKEFTVTLESVAPLLFDNRYEELHNKMKEFNEKIENNQIDEQNNHNAILLERKEGNQDSNTQELNSYGLIIDCNSISLEIGESINKIHKYVQDLFSKRFYDLESLVVNSLDYLHVVARMAKADKLSEVDLTDLLPGPTIMVVKMSASNSTSETQTLEDEEIQKIVQACEGGLKLKEYQNEILSFVESRMNTIAPNLSYLVGTNIAAKLVGIAGGMLALSRLPAGTIQVLGSNKNTLEGFSTVSTVKKHAGYIYDCELVQQTPPSYRKKVVRVLAPKCALCARIDSYGQEKLGSTGKQLREEIEKKIDKWQERPPAKQIKALPAPDEKSKRSNRGGKRVRKLKERIAMTEYRKFSNRMAFGVQEETFGNTEHGFGMLGTANRVKLHVVRDKKLQKQLHQKQIQRQKKQQKRGIRTNVGGVSGIASSLVMTPVQGMELIDPEAQAKKVAEANLKYFGGSGSYSNVKKETSKE